MNENVRVGGWALIVGSAALTITLLLHPSERGLLDPAQVESISRKMIAVHSLGLLSLPLWFIGGWAIARRVESSSWLGQPGLVFYGFALTAMMIGVVLDGLVTPGLAREIVNATPDKAIGWKIAFNHNVLLNQGFMNVFLAASALAIAAWSSAIIRTASFARGLGFFGCLLAASSLIAQFSGALGQSPHVFILILIGQAIWFFCVGVQLCAKRDSAGNGPFRRVNL